MINLDKWTIRIAENLGSLSKDLPKLAAEVLRDAAMHDEVVMAHLSIAAANRLIELAERYEKGTR